MPANLKPFQFDATVLDQLACPVCMGDLRLDGDSVACGNCGRAYPIVDGIPVLIAERATESQNSDVNPQ
jgi:uncharacterized protein